MTVTTSGTRFVIGLHDEAAGDPTTAGSKAATLARLAGKGFPVPEGFVVTTAATQHMVTTTRGDGQPASSSPIDREVWDEIVTALAALGGGPVAVRSSGVAEDLAGASYAGQYESELNVHGSQAVGAAIARCLASAHSARVHAYAGDAPRTSPMAVLVQRMVPADAAGVAFTANPVTGDDEILVSAVRGLGDRLVSGTVTPDEWIVRGAEAIRRGTPEEALNQSQVRKIADLARQVAAVAGSPQDVEWAIAGGDQYVLQARPITALPVQPRLDAPTEGFWQKDASHFPTPLTPFGASVYLPILSDATSSWGEEAGMLVQELQFRAIGGEAYARAIPIGGKERPIPPSWVMWIFTRAVPEMRRRGRAAARTLELSRSGQLLEQWSTEWRGAFREEAGRHRAVDLEALEDDALLAQLDRVTDFLTRGERLHFRLQLQVALPVVELVETCEQLLGWDSLASMALVAGRSETSSEPGRALDALAAQFAQDPAVTGVLASAGDDVVARLRDVAPTAAASFSEYLERYCHRTTSYDPGEATLFERPGLVAGLMRDRIAARDVSRADDFGAAAADSARGALAGRSADERERFEQALARAQRAYGCREDNVFWLNSVPCALVRHTVVEAGRRLAGRGVIAHATDAAFLEEPELRAALTGDAARDLRAVVARRKAERAWVIAHPGPISYGRDPGLPPDMSALPTALGHVNGALIRWLGLMSGPATVDSDGGDLTGVPGSPGTYTGTVRVVRAESEFAKLLPGDVLVCPITSPSWSVLFLQARAVVTDAGGVLAHTAVIAREYGIPAVLATGDGTQRLHDGDVVTVDGSAGTVTVNLPTVAATRA